MQKVLEPEVLYRVLLMPVTTFGNQCDLDCCATHQRQHQEHEPSYGLCDEAGSLSDCNRYSDRIYRPVEDAWQIESCTDDPACIWVTCTAAEREKFRRSDVGG